jgi:hypothetical protein
MKNEGIWSKCTRDKIPINTWKTKQWNNAFIVVLYLEVTAHIRARRNPKRKSAVFSKPNEPARGCMPVRQYHRRDESKILPHVRRGLQLDNIVVLYLEVTMIPSTMKNFSYLIVNSRRPLAPA